MRRVFFPVLASSLLAACSAKDAAKPADAGTPASATVAAAPKEVTITAKEFAFDAPDTISAGLVSLKLVNQGQQLHHVQLARLSDGKTYADLMEGMKTMKPGSPPPPWMHDVAGPNSPVPGGGESPLMVPLEAGNYAILCFIPGPDGVPHVMKGMSRALTVIPSTTAAAPMPTADVTATMTDYAWEVTPSISAGKHLIKISNNAAQSHEMFIGLLAPGKTAQDVVKWVEKMDGPPPVKPMGGISGMATGGVAYLPVNLEKGDYALFCFLPDAKDGKLHAEHGMVKPFTVN
jgi:hypothetical protein